MSSNSLILFILILILLLCISFLTLFEQYVISLSQNRLGPNKNSIFGFFQAIFDGLKLLKKENIFITKTSFIVFFISFIVFFISFIFWYFLNMNFTFINLLNNMLFFLALISFSVIFFLLIGIFNKSKYSFIGSFRFSNQSISFEIMFFFFIFIIIFLNKNFNFNFIFNFFYICFFYILLLIFLTDLNRAPFDFSEGESELVSGFNTELSSINFVLVFMSEYNMIILFSFIMSLMFNSVSFFLFFVFLIIFFRCCYPRFRYDYLMSLFWLEILFMVMLLLSFMAMMSK